MARRPIKSLSVVEVEFIAHRLAQELMDYSAPMPPFDTCFPDRLESCLKTPFQKWEGKSLYAGIILKAAMLFYFMIKNHPFKNGNKRVAILTTLVFLSQNGRWLEVENLALYEFAKEIAISDPTKTDEVIKRIVDFFTAHIILILYEEKIDEEKTP